MVIRAVRVIVVRSKWLVSLAVGEYLAWFRAAIVVLDGLDLGIVSVSTIHCFSDNEREETLLFKKEACKIAAE